jgi:hypothetical protein
MHCLNSQRGTGGVGLLSANICLFVCTWAQDERPADLHMAHPNVPVSKAYVCLFIEFFFLCTGGTRTVKSMYVSAAYMK